MSTATAPAPVAGKHRTWAVLLGVVVAIVAVTGIALGHHQGHAAYNWQQLPTPGQDLSSAGSTIGSGGGQGDGTVAVEVNGQGGQLSIDVNCRGTGTLTIKIGETQLGQVQCFAAKAVDYRLTKAIAAADVHVAVDSKVAWKVIASVGS